MSDSVAPFTPGEYERLREIRERVDAATKGPWTATVSPDETVAMVQHAMLLTDDGIGGEEPLMIASCDVVGNLNNDAAFIAASRTDVPRLLATIDARDAEIERLSKIEERATVELRLQVSRKGKRHSRSTLKEIELNDTLINVLMDILEGGKDE